MSAKVGSACVCSAPLIYRGLHTCTYTHTPLRGEVCKTRFTPFYTLTHLDKACPAVRAKIIFYHAEFFG